MNELSQNSVDTLSQKPITEYAAQMTRANLCEVSRSLGAEGLGKYPPSEERDDLFLYFLNHKSPVVLEGALYGVCDADGLSDKVVAQVKELTRYEGSRAAAAIRRIAKDTLQMIGV